MPSNLAPGLISLHGNQLERLRDEVFGWLRANPIDPLEQETFLVQSNGIAEWLKISMAERIGICAATQVMLPARFLWQMYRTLLGSAGIPTRSALDRAPLTWRIMQLLPGMLDQPGFAPLKQFMDDGDPERRLQLAQRLADLLDQYQVYRADWLADWTAGRDVTRTAGGQDKPLAPDQVWQAALWRAIFEAVSAEEPSGGRAQVHDAFMTAMAQGRPLPAAVPRRIVVFGISSMPLQTLRALAALSSRVQVIVAVLNPCQFHWADLISGRELLSAQRRRLPLRGQIDLAAIELEDLHTHAHPLLAAWGRQGRDFIRMLDEFDDSQSRRQEYPGVRMDVFSEDNGSTLLARTQAAIRDLLPLAEHQGEAMAGDDSSIEFHVAHSAQREVEVLHDRLLSLLAEPRAMPLQPREIIVMVPDVQAYAPSIRAVFNQYPKLDKRFIPFALADLRERHASPITVALDWLLRLPQQRCAQSEIRNLLAVPALARRFGLQEDGLERLGQWMEQSGIRWGLDGSHRASLGLGAAGEQNSWMFGVRRMLLGYASGERADYGDIEPYGEVGGLEADLAGVLAHLVDRLLHWQALLARNASPAQWGMHARELLKDFFRAGDEQDRLTLLKLEQALQAWLEDCAQAAFAEEVPLAILRETWLGAIDEQRLSQRFASGGVTFCTLMPMRSVPYRVVCLLGMNDGDFPRRAFGSDFDLLSLPGLARPGDRSRRDDDRYLMLETLLSAREKLYLSWVGRNIRDNSELPPSVLVAQLQDYLATGFGADIARMTTEHPLQAFSRRYAQEGGLVTWSDAFCAPPTQPAPAARPPAAPHDLLAEGSRIPLGELVAFLRQPVKYYFKRRLAVVFDEAAALGQDEEAFALDALQQYHVAAELLEDEADAMADEDSNTILHRRAARLTRAGRFPLGLSGEALRQSLIEVCLPAHQAWRHLCARFPDAAPNLHVSIPYKSLRLEGWVDKLRTNGTKQVWLGQSASRLTERVNRLPRPRPDKLIRAWISLLAAAAQGLEVTGYVVGKDAIIVIAPIPVEQAQLTLSGLLHAWGDGLQQAMPTACKTALAHLAGQDAGKAYDGDGFGKRGEVDEPCLARLWADFDALQAEPEWEAATRRLYQDLHDWCSGGQVSILGFEAVSPNTEAAA